MRSEHADEKPRRAALGTLRNRLVVVAVLVGAAVTVLPARQGSSPHAYFDALIARSDHWKSYSLRSAAQLARPRDGGFASSNSGTLMVTYSPETDDDPHAQDAAKVLIPPFSDGSGTKLVAPIGSTELTLKLSDLSGDVTKVTTSLNPKGDQIRIGSEIMITNTVNTPLDRSTGIVTLSERGALGTVAVPHSAGELVYLSSNSLSNQIRVPVNSHDGATWFFTWDAYFTDSYLRNGIGTFKAFQLSSRGAIWLEPQVRFNGDGAAASAFDQAIHVGSVGQLRSYNLVNGPPNYAESSGNRLGPGVTDDNPLRPHVNDFFIAHPNRWTRWWIRIRQRANDYDLVDSWMADEQTGPVQIYANVPVSVRDGKIDEFYVEFNTSTAQLPAGRLTDLRDLVAYVRNIVVLRDPPDDMSSFLVRPGASAAAMPRGRLRAPRNLRSTGAD